MASPRRSLHPASGNDRRALWGAVELVAGARVQFAEIVWTAERDAAASRVNKKRMFMLDRMTLVRFIVRSNARVFLRML